MTPDAGLAATSCTWNDHMIAAGGISHDPNLAAAVASVFPDWRKGGENVGMGGTVSSLFDAFVASPGHYKNLVDPDFSRVGVCVGPRWQRQALHHAPIRRRWSGRACARPSAATSAHDGGATSTAHRSPDHRRAASTADRAADHRRATSAADRAADHSGSVDRRSDRAPDDGTDDDRRGRERPAASPTSLLVAALPPSSTTATESTLADHVHDLVVEILDLFPSFLHLRLP